MCAFQSDSDDRITQATDNLGRTVTYTYDSYSLSGRPTCNSAGMLCAVTDANGGVTSYSYCGGNRMLTVDRPAWQHAQIANTYNPANGRDKQRRRLPTGQALIRFSYTVIPT